MLTKVLVANRGEIACRILRTLRTMGVRSVAVYSEADARSRHVSEADESVAIGASPATSSYLDGARILAAAQTMGAQGIHPGYGFLSENAEFAAVVEAAGIAFIGPTPDQIRKFGLKHTARELAERAGVPLLPGTGILESLEQATVEAARIGYPVMLKSTAGGGGIGLRLCGDAGELASAYDSVRRLGETHFKHAGAYLEKYVARARHVEVQVFGDGRGGVVALGERDCSLQRRNQKVVEETPAPNLPDAARQALSTSAVRLMESVSYRSAGTVEFIVDAVTSDFFFLEVNTRLQVEHGVTEEVRGVDLVDWMVRTADASAPPLRTLESTEGAPGGHSIQARIYAEDPAKNFQPSSGLLTCVTFPEGVRVDTWIERGAEVSPFYDPLLAKIVVWGQTREEAVARLSAALAATRLDGIETNLEYLRCVAETPEFVAGAVTTQLLRTIAYSPRGIDVVAPGTQSTIQDHPGRVGYWAVGVPPSGPMDALSHRLGNRVVGNAGGAPALEMTMTGPTLKFRAGAIIALSGAAMDARLDGQRVPYFEPVEVRAGQTLVIGAVRGGGARTYLSVRGGFDVPAYLGSRATFTLGAFGGHAGRALRTGDVLHVGVAAGSTPPRKLPPDLVPEYRSEWAIGALEGPHAAPDFFTEAFMARFYEVAWKVHYNSARTGVRLVGPKPEWVRPDGGEAGLHPSNIHDTAYAIGAVDFTGDMPIILGPDGPSLGGFVCPVTIATAELWKTGQLKPGDTVRFVPWSEEVAREADLRQEREIATLAKEPSGPPLVLVRTSPVVGETAETDDTVQVTYRRSGDAHLLVEYGPMVLDLALRLRVHVLMRALEERKLPGIVDLTPGIRSLQIHYDPRALTQSTLLGVLREAEASLGNLTDVTVPSRIVRLPLSWDDPATQVAIQKYVQSVRPDAPWAPSNIEFIRRINGLESVEDVKRIVFGASYLVLGLGDVYLGAPVATPVDPRHRLVTTKYNPARTWTPENAVGIGGAYLCIYGMEGPGGYQFVGRTLQVWNRFKRTRSFAENPWLLRFFDRIEFYPVSASELLEMREAFVSGRVDVSTQDGTFSFRDYETMLRTEQGSIAAFKARQQRAFDAERERWIAKGQLQFSTESNEAKDALPAAEVVVLPEGTIAVESHVSGSVWKIHARAGARVEAGASLVVVESMKMEVDVEAPSAGMVVDISCQEGRPVNAGQTLLIFRPDPPIG